MVVGSKVRKSGKAPIEIRITLNGKKTVYSVGLTVMPGNWDENTKVVSEAEPNFKAINKLIQKALVDLEHVYDQLFFTFDKVTPTMIKRAYKGEDVEDKPKVEEVPTISLIEMFDGYIKKFEKLVEKKQRSGGTLRQWRSSRKKQ